MRKDTNGAAPTIFFLRSVPFFTCPTLLPLQNPHFRCPCSALASATRRYVEGPPDTCCLRLGRIYAEHHQLARVADSPTLFPVYMKSREAHFLAAAGRRGGGPKFGCRSDNLFSLHVPFFTCPTLPPLQNPHCRRRARRAHFRQDAASGKILVHRSPARPGFWTGRSLPIGCP
jgi:hypothetical protein